MNRSVHDNLIQDTERLRARLRTAATVAVVRSCQAYNLQSGGSPGAGPSLSSPGRQQAFLLGLLASTPEPHQPSEFKHKDWERCADLLQSIFASYALAMWPEPDQLGRLSEESLRTREVAGQALLHYHNTGLLATVSQVRTRIERYLTPFDSALAEAWGLSATQAASVCDWIKNDWLAHNDSLAAAAQQEEEERLGLVEEWARRDLSLDDFREFAGATEYRDTVQTLLQLIDETTVLRRERLLAVFPEVADAFWAQFTVARGSIQLTYLTETNPIDARPLLLVGADRAMALSVNALYLAVLHAGESTLEESAHAESYRTRRDRTLETEVEVALRELLGGSATYLPRVYETPNRQHEHDLVAVAGRSVLVAESKASPPREPFRDPEKAFTRLQRAFRSERGIQKAYEQADRVRRRLAEGEEVPLYDASGSVVETLRPEHVDAVYTICITRDDFGPLAVDLALLLDRPDKSDPYPWAVDILSLQSIAAAWTYLGMSRHDFLRYLEQRGRLHGRSLVWDELDVAGVFLKHGGLHWLLDTDADKLQILPYYSELFDRIDAARSGLGPEVVVEVTEPAFADSRQMLMNMLQQLHSASRNDPCPCGSGRKFKKCHGRNR